LAASKGSFQKPLFDVPADQERNWLRPDQTSVDASAIDQAEMKPSRGYKSLTPRDTRDIWIEVSEEVNLDWPHSLAIEGIKQARIRDGANRGLVGLEAGSVSPRSTPTMNQIRGSKQLQIGALMFPGVDQIDLTGPFEIFSRLPGATYHTIAKDKKPIRDTRGLIHTISH